MASYSQPFVARPNAIYELTILTAGSKGGVPTVTTGTLGDEETEISSQLDGSGKPVTRGDDDDALGRSDSFTEDSVGEWNSSISRLLRTGKMLVDNGEMV